MFYCLSKTKKSFSLIVVILTLFVLSFSFGCGKSYEENPKPSVGEKRFCSFSVSDIDSAFSINSIDLTVKYGINSAATVNCIAAFIVYDYDGGKPPMFLQKIENFANDDYSFTVTDGNYSYKQKTVLHLESGFFDKTKGEFSICLCLFSAEDALYENPLSGYRYNIKYRVAEDKIIFETKNESVIRHH